jgi:spore maturation protein CgeB
VVGDDYAHAIQAADFNLGLLSKGNRDEHTTRSLEVPMLGALLCAERTPEHMAMYREGEEALFWKDAAECAAVIRRYLDRPAERTEIAAAGARRVRANGHGNERIVARALRALAGEEAA